MKSERYWRDSCGWVLLQEECACQCHLRLGLCRSGEPQAGHRGAPGAPSGHSGGRVNVKGCATVGANAEGSMCARLSPHPPWHWSSQRTAHTFAVGVGVFFPATNASNLHRTQGEIQKEGMDCNRDRTWSPKLGSTDTWVIVSESHLPLYSTSLGQDVAHSSGTRAPLQPREESKKAPTCNCSVSASGFQEFKGIKK